MNAEQDRRKNRDAAVAVALAQTVAETATGVANVAAAAAEKLAKTTEDTARDSAEARAKLHARVDDLDRSVSDLHVKVKANTEATLLVVANTADIIEVWQSVKGGLQVLGWIGKTAKWGAGIALFVSAVIGTYHAVTAFLHRGGS